MHVRVRTYTHMMQRSVNANRQPFFLQQQKPPQAPREHLQARVPESKIHLLSSFLLKHREGTVNAREVFLLLETISRWEQWLSYRFRTEYNYYLP